jgi:hypothetical protein
MNGSNRAKCVGICDGSRFVVGRLAVLSLADLAVIFKKGRIVRRGAPDGPVADPASMHRQPGTDV